MATDFRKATDELLASISHQELAKALGVSVPTVRQARLDVDAKAHRKAPEGWETIVTRLAQNHANRLHRLAKRLKTQHAK